MVTADWTAPATPGAGIDGYGVFLYDARDYTGRSLWVSPTSPTATFSGLTKGEPYMAVVIAHNVNGRGGNGSTNWTTAG